MAMLESAALRGSLQLRRAQVCDQHPLGADDSLDPLESRHDYATTDRTQMPRFSIPADESELLLATEHRQLLSRSTQWLAF
ncbi:hypothetical protein PC120_g19452 [Phytophthora cactorum]|nr:hypothetical protein PC120_g19452 [Phytophthora cactorum]